MAQRRRVMPGQNTIPVVQRSQLRQVHYRSQFKKNFSEKVVYSLSFVSDKLFLFEVIGTESLPLRRQANNFQTFFLANSISRLAPIFVFAVYQDCTLALKEGRMLRRGSRRADLCWFFRFIRRPETHLRVFITS